jgi:hypothetical protein
MPAREKARPDRLHPARRAFNRMVRYDWLSQTLFGSIQEV